MLGTLTGFAVVALAVAVGYILARVDLLGPHAQWVLSRLTFFVLTPFLLFVVLSQADATLLFSSLLPVSAIAALVVITVHVVVTKRVWKRSVGETVIGALATGMVNSNNIGIPLSVYLLGSAAYPAPVILFQVLVLTPVALTLLEASKGEKISRWRVMLRSATNPIVLSSIVGTLVSVSGITLPPLVLEPATLLANACVPILLISYGLSLRGNSLLGVPGRRRDVWLSTTLKLIVMPVVAWATAEFVFGLPSQEVFILVVLAALPSAQNVFNYAQHYGAGENMSRDTVMVTTIGCVPVLLIATVLLT